MADLIERSAAIEALTDKNIIDHMDSVQDGELHRVKRAVQRIIATLTPVDAVPVRHGRWINCGWSIRCSICGHDMPFAVRNFCPNCGAIMHQ